MSFRVFRGLKKNPAFLVGANPTDPELFRRFGVLKLWSFPGTWILGFGISARAPKRGRALLTRTSNVEPQTSTIPSRGGEADDFLFAPDGERACCRRQESFLDVFPGAGKKIAAATQVELVLNVFAVALNRFYTEMK